MSMTIPPVSNIKFCCRNQEESLPFWMKLGMHMFSPSSCILMFFAAIYNFIEVIFLLAAEL